MCFNLVNELYIKKYININYKYVYYIINLYYYTCDVIMRLIRRR